MPLIGHVIPWNPRAICNYTSFLLFVKPPQQLFYLVILSPVDPVQNQIFPGILAFSRRLPARTLCHPFHFINYEVEMTVNGHSKDISMTADGSIVEIEEQVSLDSLSPEVKAGLQAKARKGKILKVESLTKKDKLVAYEAQVETNGKKSEVQVGPDGKPLDHEE
jgi:hypothetical protein